MLRLKRPTRVFLNNSSPKPNLPKECDEVPVHGDALDHPVGERHPAYVDVVAAANGILDADVLKSLVAKPETSAHYLELSLLERNIGTLQANKSPFHPQVRPRKS